MGSVKTQFTVLVMGACGLVALLMTVADIAKGVAAAKGDAAARQETALRSAALVFSQAIDGFAEQVGADGTVTGLSWQQMPAFDDHGLVDSIGGVTGETVTVFTRGADGDFWRQTTNIRKPDGSRAIGTPLGKDGAVFPVVARGETFRGEARIFGEDYVTIYKPIRGASGEVEGILYVGVSNADVAGVWISTAFWIGGIALVAMAVVAPIAHTLVGRALVVLTDFQADMSRLEAGQLDQTVSGQDRADEIGQLAHGLEALRLSLQEAEQVRGRAEGERVAMLDSVEAGVGVVVEAAKAGDFSARVDARFDAPQLTRLAEGVNAICETSASFLSDVEATVGPMASGDLSRRVATTHRGAFARVAERLNSALEQLTTLIGDVQGASVEGRAAIERLQAGIEGLAATAETHAAALEEASAAMTEMADGVTANAAAVDEASGAARHVREGTGEGATAVASTVEAVNRIKDSSNQINTIIGMIEGIAFQTNLLALNASVEAARAGEAGKGFAVVASEVRALAQRAADSSRQIAALVNTSNAHVGDGIARVGVAGEALHTIKDASATLEERIGGLAAAGKQQATGVSEISATIAQMDRMTQENAAESEKFAAELRELSGQIARIAESASVFQTGSRDQARPGSASSARMIA